MKERTRKLVLFAMLAAITIIMAFTPIGYLRVGVISITFMMIPVIICAASLGVFYGALSGLLFGITSFVQCFGMSAFGTVLFSINPYFTFLNLMVPRVLLGVFAALIYKGLSKRKIPVIVTDVITMLVSAILHTLMFVAILILCFGQTEYINSFGENFWMIIWTLVGLNGIIEWVVCATVGAAILKALQFFINKRRSA